MVEVNQEKDEMQVKSLFDPDNEGRLNINKGFGVEIRDLTSGDSGEYACMVNSRKKPNVIIRLLVQGKKNAGQKRKGRPKVLVCLILLAAGNSLKRVWRAIEIDATRNAKGIP